VVARFRRGSHDASEGLYYARAQGDRGMDPAILRTDVFRNLRISPTTIRMAPAEAAAGKAFTVSSDRYAHAVHLGLDDDTRLSDDYFDLLPGESRTVTVLSGRVPDDLRKIAPRSVLSKPPAGGQSEASGT